ncbi:hypothetical protein [Nostoc sp.]
MISQYYDIRLNLYDLRNLVLANPTSTFFQPLAEIAQLCRI